jgi:hypothetical protein
MRTRARSRHRNAASCCRGFSTGGDEARSKLLAYAATKAGSLLPDAASAHRIASLTLTSAVDPRSRPLAVAGHSHPLMPKSP